MIMPYKTDKVGVPSIRNEFDTTPSSTTSICKQGMIHTLAKIDVDFEEIEPTKQEIGSFSGFHTNIQSPVPKSKPYYYLTLPKPPGKSVVNEVMMRMLDVIMNMHFIQLVGDLPVYKLIVQLKNETFYQSLVRFIASVPLLMSSIKDLLDLVYQISLFLLM